MNYENLFHTNSVVKVGLIGTGAFGNSFLYQTQSIASMEVVAVCDQKVSISRKACLQAGIPVEKLSLCGSAHKGQAAIENNRIAILEDPLLMMALPIDVIVEATGVPEVGATHAKAALEHGKHMVMVSKETDVVVGPILTKLAADRGLVYTPSDGDQPSLLLGLISWIDTLGLEVICAGKSGEHDFVYDETAGIISHGQDQIKVAGSHSWELWSRSNTDEMAALIEKRNQALSAIPQITVPDLAEMTIVMNSTRYGYDNAQLRRPIARITELAEVFRCKLSGGILESEGVIDAVNCLRRKGEISLAGGVFAVVKCHDLTTWELLAEKDHVVSQDRTHALIYRPYHFLGVETPISVLSAALLKHSTGGNQVQPKFDMVVRTTRHLSAGHTLTMSGQHRTIDGTEPELAPAHPIRPDHPIPFYMAANTRLIVDVPPGVLITYGMVEHPSHSVLWDLKEQQDIVFLEVS